MKLFHSYDYNEQWTFSSLILYIGSRESIHYVSDLSCYIEQRKHISPTIDIDLRINYDYDKQLNFFAELVNVLNHDYTTWDELPVNSRQLNLGLNYHF
jgi:outer membrane cobalamin receptor